MKAMVLDKPGLIEHNRLRLAELPRPAPAENEILVKVSACGVCHTDLDEIEGRLPPTKWPIVPGHQIVGTVADKGISAARFGIEQRVGITWLYSSYGKCSFCQSGCENLCDDAKWTGKDVDEWIIAQVMVSRTR